MNANRHEYPYPSFVFTKISRVKQRLNTEAVACMTPAMLTQVDPDGDVRGWFMQMAAMMGGAA